MERDRRATCTLEIEVDKRSEFQGAADHQESLCAEIYICTCTCIMLCVHGRCYYIHGPDSVKRFKQFSMSAVIAELQSSCPEVYKPVQQFGNTQRNGALPMNS